MDRNGKKLHLILASGSPRRRELISLLGVPFEVLVSDEEEIVTDTEPKAVTAALSRQKAFAVAKKMAEAADKNRAADVPVIIGADTVVAVDGKILGKPQNEEEAGAMLRLLQGRSHMVYTGVSLVRPEGRPERAWDVRTFTVGTKVHVAAMSEEEITRYVKSGDCMDKAGGYGIQGEFSRHIAGIEGDYFNVVGLPVHRLYEELKKIW